MQTSKRALVIADAIARWRFAEALQDSAVVAFAAAMDVSESVAMDTLQCPELADSVVADLGVELQPYTLQSTDQVKSEIEHDLRLVADRVDYMHRLFLCGLVVLALTLVMAALA
jgi:hypothetical protein